MPQSTFNSTLGIKEISEVQKFEISKATFIQINHFFQGRGLDFKSRHIRNIQT